MLEEKRRMLLDLENLKACSSNLHWILVGDFNIITTLWRKREAPGDWIEMRKTFQLSLTQWRWWTSKPVMVSSHGTTKG
jgi:hypothetical protein